MIGIKRIRTNELLDIKENHVLTCFTDYLYHKHASDFLQEELDQISLELSGGIPSAGIIKVSKDAKGKLSTWQNELLTRESILIHEQDKHIEAMQQVDDWLANIKNDHHREIVIQYLINNQCENAEAVAKKCNTTKGNVSNVSNRIIRNIARKKFLK